MNTAADARAWATGAALERVILDFDATDRPPERPPANR
jgi:hypothetical protein